MDISQFEINGTVGKGAFGEVFMVTKKATKKEYAIKVMNKAFIEKEQKMVDIFREKEILKFVKHPNIIKAEASFQNKENIYLVLELVEGDELSKLIKHNKSLDLRICQIIIKQMVEAIAYLHQNGIYHGDIKPQNVIVKKDYTIKLCDFGGSNIFMVTDQNKGVFDSIERFKQKMKTTSDFKLNGTTSYASPELVETSINTWQDDIWSLGVTAYQMMTGRLPFDEETEWLIFEKINKMEFNRDLSSIGVNESNFVNSLLKRATEKRLGCSGDWLDASALLNHKFLTMDIVGGKLPQILFERSKLFDKSIIFTFGPVKSGMDLMTDFAVLGNWYIFPNRINVVLKSNRTLYIMSEDGITILSSYNLDALQKLLIKGSTILELYFNKSEPLLLEFFSSFSKEWVDKILSIH